MRSIDRGPEPEELTTYRSAAFGDPNDGDWDAVPTDTKTALREALWAVQGGCCAYCGTVLGRPLSECTKLEHLHPRKTAAWESSCARGLHPALESDARPVSAWHNILLCCRGNEGETTILQHCDTFKDDKHVCATAVFPDDMHLPRRVLLEVDDRGRVFASQHLERSDADRLVELIGDATARDPTARRGGLNLNAAPLLQARLNYQAALVDGTTQSVSQQFPWIDDAWR